MLIVLAQEEEEKNILEDDGSVGYNGRKV